MFKFISNHKVAAYRIYKDNIFFCFSKMLNLEHLNKFYVKIHICFYFKKSEDAFLVMNMEN